MQEVISLAPDIEDLLQLMEKNEKLRYHVRDKLLKSGKSVFDHLVKALRSSRKSTIRRNAAIILGEMGNRKAVEALIKALKDRVVSVSSNAAIALGMIGDKRAVVPLIERLHSSSWQLRLNAAISLGWIADHGASDSLLRLLRDQHAYVRRGATFALGQIGNLALREPLLRLLKDEKNPVVEAAVVLASMGDLSGYFYLDIPLPDILNVKLPRSNGKNVAEALKLGNLFYSSSLFTAALAEYRRALASQEKISASTYLAILNNLGNTFRAIGQPDHAIVFYLLALRIKPRDLALLQNLRIAETLSEIQELLLEHLKQWVAGHKTMDPPQEFVEYFRSVSQGLTSEVLKRFLPHFISGWKAFYAFEAYRGEAVSSFDAPIPVQFLADHIAVCRNVLTTEPSFRSFYLLLLKMSDGSLSQKDADSGEETVSLFHEAFLCGYLIGLLQKIWWMSHLRFSMN